MSANPAVKINNNATARQEVAESLGEAFDNLAMAATAKNETIKKMVTSIAELTATNASHNKLVEELREELKGVKRSIRNIQKGTAGRGCGRGNNGGRGTGGGRGGNSNNNRDSGNNNNNNHQEE